MVNCSDYGEVSRVPRDASRAGRAYASGVAERKYKVFLNYLTVQATSELPPDAAFYRMSLSNVMMFVAVISKINPIRGFYVTI